MRMTREIPKKFVTFLIVGSVFLGITGGVLLSRFTTPSVRKAHTVSEKDRQNVQDAITGFTVLNRKLDTLLDLSGRISRSKGLRTPPRGHTYLFEDKGVTLITDAQASAIKRKRHVHRAAVGGPKIKRKR